MQNRTLTALAHDFLKERITSGDVLIDATAGNGHDTLFLAQQAGSSGVVFAFDPQPEALEQTRQRLAEHGVEASCRLIPRGHEAMLEVMGGMNRGKVKAIVFNLGYLPGSDKSVTTRAGTTLAALEQSLELLAPEGVMSLLIYKGHAGGKEEARAVKVWLQSKPELRYASHLGVSPDDDSPELWLVQRNT